MKITLIKSEWGDRYEIAPPIQLATGNTLAMVRVNSVKANGFDTIEKYINWVVETAQKEVKELEAIRLEREARELADTEEASAKAAILAANKAAEMAAIISLREGEWMDIAHHSPGDFGESGWDAVTRAERVDGRLYVVVANFGVTMTGKSYHGEKRIEVGE